MKRDQPVPDHVKPVIVWLIDELGGKRAAKRAIDAAEAKGQGGRRKGTQQYLEADLKLLFESELLQTEYVLDGKERVRKGLPPRRPKGRRPLIAEIVPENTAGLGRSKDAVVARLAKRGSVARLFLDAIRPNRPDLMKLLPEDADARLRSAENDPDKVNFSTIFMLLAVAAAFQQRHAAAAHPEHDQPDN